VLKVLLSSKEKEPNKSSSIQDSLAFGNLKEILLKYAEKLFEKATNKRLPLKKWKTIWGKGTKTSSGEELESSTAWHGLKWEGKY
jgi:hypothetical protein